MTQARQLSLFVAITLWATIIGGVAYSHIAYFPPYLSHLPESNKLITGDYGFRDADFWKFIHPIAMLSTILALVLNWKIKERRKFILITLAIYTLAIIATVIYFVPGLMAFSDSTNNTTVTAAEWYQRGQNWEHLSWIRGAFMYVGFILLLVAVTKNNSRNTNS